MDIAFCGWQSVQISLDCVATKKLMEETHAGSYTGHVAARFLYST